MSISIENAKTGGMIPKMSFTHKIQIVPFKTDTTTKWDTLNTV